MLVFRKSVHPPCWDLIEIKLCGVWDDLHSSNILIIPIFVKIGQLFKQLKHDKHTAVDIERLTFWFLGSNREEFIENSATVH